MFRVVVLLRDLVIALALGWIGVTIVPAAEEAACPVKGADSAPAVCTSARAPSFNVAGFGMELQSPGACPNG